MKRRDEAKEQARLLSEVADAVERLAVRAALQEGACVWLVFVPICFAAALAYLWSQDDA